MTSNNRQIPVFAFPSTLKFYLCTRSSHIQVLNLHNPWDFLIKYKVHCHASSWDKYVVRNPEGTIPPQSSVQLVVTHRQVIPANCNQTDRFRVVLQDSLTDEVVGRKTIEAVLLPGERDYTQSSENDFVDFHSQEGSIRSATPTLRVSSGGSRSAPHTNNNLLIGSIVVVCTAVLFLPTEIEVTKPSSLPSYLHVSHKIQLLAAMLLGAFLCVLVRS